MLPAPTTTYRRLTAAELARRPDAENYELVDGELVEREMSNRTSAIGGEFHRRLANWAAERSYGRALPDNVSYSCFPGLPDLVRKPDVSFFTRERWSPALFDATHIERAPDLIVEILSPYDHVYDSARKINEFFAAGTQEAWVVHPDTRQLERRLVLGTSRWLEADEPIEGAPLLPGFVLRLSDVLRMALATRIT